MSDNGKPQVQSLAVKVKTVKDLFESNRLALAAALPKHITADRMIRVAMTSVQTVPKLIDCTPRSLLAAIVQCAQLGLEPGILGHIYLVPFWNKKRNAYEVQIIPGYKGLLALCRRSGDISTVTVHEVRAGDHFVYEYGHTPKLEHRPSESVTAVDVNTGEVTDRPITHFYAVARLKDGGTQFEVMTKRQVDQHRDRYSKAAQDGPWITNFAEMGCKTVLRRLTKLLPMAIEAQTAVVLSELAENQQPQMLEATLGLAEPEPDSPADEATPGAATLDKAAEAIGAKA